MGYVDKQIAAAQKKLGDAVAGKGLRDAIRKLQEKSKIRNSLEDAPTRGALVAKRKLAKRGGSAALNTELRTLYSSDGIFTIEYWHVLGLN